jgi:hypothetical protein
VGGKEEIARTRYLHVRHSLLVCLQLSQLYELFESTFPCSRLARLERGGEREEGREREREESRVCEKGRVRG